mmetsp:Transcript_9544/g.17974  ORF Transcript_9544/g.17974 Transcript_9544/m.17974 type:complete len:381 (-) Transcript_9544:132-1274(-)
MECGEELAVHLDVALAVRVHGGDRGAGGGVHSGHRHEDVEGVGQAAELGEVRQHFLQGRVVVHHVPDADTVVHPRHVGLHQREEDALHVRELGIVPEHGLHAGVPHAADALLHHLDGDFGILVVVVDVVQYRVLAEHQTELGAGEVDEERRGDDGQQRDVDVALQQHHGVAVVRDGVDAPIPHRAHGVRAEEEGDAHVLDRQERLRAVGAGPAPEDKEQGEHRHHQQVAAEAVDQGGDGPAREEVRRKELAEVRLAPEQAHVGAVVRVVDVDGPRRHQREVRAEPRLALVQVGLPHRVPPKVAQLRAPGTPRAVGRPRAVNVASVVSVCSVGRWLLGSCWPARVHVTLSTSVRATTCTTASPSSGSCGDNHEAATHVAEV